MTLPPTDLAGFVDLLAVVLMVCGLFFFAAGSVGLLRFPDLHSRLHALTKADNLGLGFIVLAAAVHGRDAWQAGKLLMVWGLAMLAAATAAQLLARSALVHRGLAGRSDAHEDTAS